MDVQKWMEDIPIKSEIVFKTLKQQNSNKSPVDGIQAKFLKLFVHPLGHSLAEIFNTSIESANLPQDWKNARVTALFNNGDSKKTRKL